MPTPSSRAPGQAALDVEGLLGLTEPEYRASLQRDVARAGALRRPGPRTPSSPRGASGDGAYLDAVRALLESEYEGVRAAARWAVERLGAAVSSR